MASTVLVPHDFGDAANAALAWAAEWSRATGASVRLLHVIPPTAAMYSAALPRADHTVADEASTARAELAAAALAHRIAVETDVCLAPDVGAAVIAAAKEHGVDLIVMGTHGRAALRRAWLGSVAEYVVRHASCPVVTMRAPDASSHASVLPG